MSNTLCKKCGEPERLLFSGYSCDYCVGGVARAKKYRLLVIDKTSRCVVGCGFPDVAPSSKYGLNNQISAYVATNYKALLGRQFELTGLQYTGDSFATVFVSVDNIEYRIDYKLLPSHDEIEIIKSPIEPEQINVGLSRNWIAAP